MKRRITVVLFTILVLFFFVIYFCNYKIESYAAGRIYSSSDSIPYNKVGLLLGMPKFFSKNDPNPYFRNRIAAAAKLIKAGKIKYLIVSGANDRKGYDEPSQMRADLIALGIDSTIIFKDPDGFRTYYSVIRAKEVFGQSSITMITQEYHNERAIFIASKEKINAIGFNAVDVDGTLGFKIQFREKFARVKLFIDYLFGKRPDYSGEQIRIPE